MENRCQRCDRVLSDPNAVFGWRCAEILGVSGELSKMGADIFRKFVDGVMKAQRLFGKSNIQFTDERRKNLYSAFAKMSLWEGIDEKKVKQARKESHQAINSTKAKIKSLLDELKEYKEYMEKHGIISGISKKLADDNKLDDITNSVFKVHDTIQKLPNASSNFKAIANYLYNKKLDLSSYNDAYINDQNTGAVSKLKFGVSTMDNNGCGVIATYNAMKALGNKKDIRDIAYYYESDGQALGGLFGTNPYSIKRYFEKEGYKVKSIEGKPITEKELPEADAYIVTFWNSDNAMDAMHTIAMRKKNDKYELFNNNPRTEQSDVVQTLSEALLKDGAVPLSVHCISK